MATILKKDRGDADFQLAVDMEKLLLLLKSLSKNGKFTTNTGVEQIGKTVRYRLDKIHEILEKSYDCLRYANQTVIEYDFHADMRMTACRDALQEGYHTITAIKVLGNENRDAESSKWFSQILQDMTKIFNMMKVWVTSDYKRCLKAKEEIAAGTYVPLNKRNKKTDSIVKINSRGRVTKSAKSKNNTEKSEKAESKTVETKDKTEQNTESLNNITTKEK